MLLADLKHHRLLANDLDQTKRFYCDVLDLQ